MEKNAQNGDDQENEKEKEKKLVNLSLIPYWFLAVLRFGLCLTPQTGYIHPDEYFQSLEVLNGDIFSVTSNRPWEFNSTFPIRSITLHYVLAGIPLIFFKNISPFISLWFDVNPINPYSLIAIPRFTYCLFSFTTDICMYKICYLYGQNYRTRLLTLASSYVMLVYATRSFSNTIEMALMSLLVYLVADSMANSDQIIYQDEYLRECYNHSNNIKDRVRFHRMRLALPWHTLSNVFFIATLTTVGMFNRPTFVVFAFPPVFFWLLRGMGSKFIGMTDFNMRVLALMICALPSFFVMVILDSMYFGYLTLDEIVHWKVNIWRDFVLTPYNFIKYNMNSDNLAQHGIHPRITHILVNIPLLYNILGLAGIYSFLHLIYRGAMKRWSSLPRVQSIIGLMTTSFVVPVVILSIFPHQEPRFLIGCTLPIVFLYSQKIRNVTEHQVITKQENGYTAFMKKDIKLDIKDYILALWYIINIVLTLFFGYIHQAGISPLINHLYKELEAKPRLTHMHVITSHIYPLPVSFLQMRFGKSAQYYTKTGSRYQRSKDFFTYELGSSISMDVVVENIKAILNRSENLWNEKRLKYRIYYVAPSSLMNDFQAAAFNQNLTQLVDTMFYPHLSVEALPKFEVYSVQKCNDHGNEQTCHLEDNLKFSLELPLKYLSSLAHQFSLTVYKIKNV